ncbi:MAG: hypothetical protein JW827_09115 [Spirochaetes bacterium]|nr:hypothetical protein [Spirochaetota bacterium]
MKKLILPLMILFLAGCGVEEIVQPEYLNAPSNLKAYPGNGTIRLEFLSNNKEDKFDGFNIYISKSSSLKSQSSLLPVQNPSTGGIPTIVKTSKEINPDSSLFVEINRDNEDKPIENGITYYFICRAHSIRNFKSEPSNETSTTPRIESTASVVLNTNEGFSFTAFSQSAPFDFIFTVQDVSGKKAFLTGKNNTQIQSKGYYDDWKKVNKADTEGYLMSEIPIQVQQGYVILLKTSSGHYAKIYIESLDLSSDPAMRFIWAFQQLVGNIDI